MCSACSRVVAPANCRLREAYLRQRERLGRVDRVNPPHDTKQNVPCPSYVEHSPKAVRLARRAQQEVVRSPF